MNTHTPPTTRVSEDGLCINFREFAFSIPVWRYSLQKLARSIDDLLMEICLGHDFGFSVPKVVPDDWTSTARQYSCIHNAKFVPDQRGLLQKMLLLPGQRLAFVQENTLKFRPAIIQEFLNKCNNLLLKLALYAFFTAGQTPRVAEFMDHKFANSNRPRTMFFNENDLWLVTRRTKTEAKTRKESFIPMKCHPHLMQVMMKYLTIIRPVEQELVQQMSGPEAGELYQEFMWVKSGERMPITDFYKAVKDFNKEQNPELPTDLGSQAYRQIMVEVGRVYLGSEAQTLEEVDDAIAEQAGHTALTAQIKYAAGVGALPGMSSDQLARFGRASELWWDVAGARAGVPATLPLATRSKTKQQFCISSGNSINQDNIMSTPPSTSGLDLASYFANFQAFVSSEIQGVKASIRDEVRHAVAEAGAIQEFEKQERHQPQTGDGSSFVPQQNISLEPTWENLDEEVHHSGDTTLVQPFPHQNIDINRNQQLPSSQPPMPCQDKEFCPSFELKSTCLGLLYEHYPDMDTVSFRSKEQLQAVALSVLRKKSFVAVLPTGSGKSLIFTLPPFKETKLRTYVVVPNRSLLEDHLRRAKKLAIIAGHWTAQDKRLPEGVQLVFVAMETAVSQKFYE
jgi:hypothetical protein